MQKDYYQQYYKLEREHWWFQVRGEIILEHIESISKDFSGRLKILNIGVATGHTSTLLSKIGEVKSVEYDKECYEFTRQLPDMDIINASITELPFADETFDLVCAFDVVEHIADDVKAVSEMNRVCKKGGKLCVTVPAFMLLWSEHDIINHHERRYTKPQLSALFTDNELIFSTYFNFLLFLPIAAFRILKTAISGKPKVEDAQSDFMHLEQNIFTKLTRLIFAIEKPFLRNRIKFPFGVSILLSAKKK